jgi:glycosyltransferase involved in cell wall biosynthesis
MACGTPAIVTEHTGAKDAVVQGGGFVIPPGDVAALKQHMLDCYNNRAQVEVMGKKAAASAAQYTLDNYEQQIVKALRQITDAKNQG